MRSEENGRYAWGKPPSVKTVAIREEKPPSRKGGGPKGRRETQHCDRFSNSLFPTQHSTLNTPLSNATLLLFCFIKAFELNTAALFFFQKLNARL